MKPIYDSWDKDYKSVFGALRQGETCRFSIRLPKDVTPDFPPVLVLFRTGFKERFLSMQLSAEEDDCNVYSTEYKARYSDVHYYYFSYTVGGIRRYIKKVNCHESNLDSGDLFQLTVYGKEYETPDFLKGGVMYQIFPDRFNFSGEEKNIKRTDLQIQSDWYNCPEWRPNEHGEITNTDFFKGDLDGFYGLLIQIWEAYELTPFKKAKVVNTGA